MNTDNYCNKHMCPAPCTTCEDDRAWSRAKSQIDDGLHELDRLYKRAGNRRNQALRQVGVLAVELATIKQHKPTEDETKSA